MNQHREYAFFAAKMVRRKKPRDNYRGGAINQGPQLIVVAMSGLDDLRNGNQSIFCEEIRPGAVVCIGLSRSTAKSSDRKPVQRSRGAVRHGCRGGVQFAQFLRKGQCSCVIFSPARDIKKLRDEKEARGGGESTMGQAGGAEGWYGGMDSIEGEMFT